MNTETKEQVYSVFLNEYKHKEHGWVQEHLYMYGDQSHLDLKTDYRHKEIPNKKKQSVFLGLCYVTFPVEYPVTLTNGKVIEKLKGDFIFEHEG